MCTALGINLGDFYFGRTLDVDRDYGQKVVLTPRNFDYQFRSAPRAKTKFAIIGMAKEVSGYPLYFDALNEKGLCMAGLRFLEFYCPIVDKRQATSVAPFEFIPFVLSQCEDVSQAEVLLQNTCIVNADFNPQLPVTPLHWIISDKFGSLTVETTHDGMRVYKNEVGVLTNSPSFNFQMFNLNNYSSLSPRMPDNTFSKDLQLKNYSYGLGALGLPGDLSSMSRFVRAVYYKYNIVGSTCPEADFLRVINTCFQPKGLTVTDEERLEYTAYTSCCNADKGIYAYCTYDSLSLKQINMNDFDLEGREPIVLLNEKESD